jgi:flagellin-like protein
LKGVSPLIATVLILAFTLAVALIVGTWLSFVTKKETEIVESGMKQQINCTKAVLEVVDAKCTDNDLTIAIANLGPIELTDPHFYARLTNGTSATWSTNNTISPGGQLINKTSPGWDGGTLDYVVVTALCAGTTGIKAEKSDIGDPC